MKKALFCLAALSLSSIAMATCPDLEGAYSCDYSGGRRGQELIIDQKNVSGVTQFIFNGERMRADGIKRKAPDNEHVMNRETRVRCAGTKLEAWERAQLRDRNGYIETILEVSLSGRRNLMGQTKGKLVVDGRETPVQESFTCLRRFSTW